MGDVTDTSALALVMVEIPWCTLVMSGTMTPKKMTGHMETSLKCMGKDTRLIWAHDKNLNHLQQHILEHYCQSY